MGNTVVYLCTLPGCCHEEEKVYNLPYFDCPWCGCKMLPIQGSEKPIPGLEYYKGMARELLKTLDRKNNEKPSR